MNELEAGTPQPAPPSVYKYCFNIGSIDSFERKMEEAQEDLGIGPNSYVPIVYTTELSWQQVSPSSPPGPSGSCRNSCCCRKLPPLALAKHQSMQQPWSAA